MALTIEQRLRQGLFLESPIGYKGPFDVALAALLGPDDDRPDERDVELLDWGVTFGATFAIARQEDPWESTQSVAVRALDPAESAWQRYSGDMPSALASQSRRSGRPGSSRRRDSRASRAACATEALRYGLSTGYAAKRSL
jgi:hypothetical protein